MSFLFLLGSGFTARGKCLKRGSASREIEIKDPRRSGTALGRRTNYGKFVSI